MAKIPSIFVMLAVSFCLTGRLKTLKRRFKVLEGSMYKFLLAVTLLVIPTAVSASVYANWGLRFDYPGPSQYSDIQNYALGYHNQLSSKLDYVVEGGGWKDQGHYPGARPGGYLATGIGMDLKLQERYISYFVGPSFVTPTDTLLGSNFEVYQKLSGGFRDDRDERIGLFVKHFSDAGLSRVNYGRNFLGIEVSF